MNRLKKISFLLLISFKLTSVEAQHKILFVTSNQAFYGGTKISASNHFEEIIVPFDIFIKAGYLVGFVTWLADIHRLFFNTKYQGAWKIVHKSYTWRELPKAEKK
jgi:hypothetical protein